MKKICFLLGGFQGNGGIGRVTSILVNNLCHDEDLEVHTVSYVKDQRPMLYDLDTAVFSHVLYSSAYSMTKAILFHGAVSKLRSILKKQRIDYLIACGALYYPLGILACKRTKTKVVCWEHTNPATSTDHKFQNLCRKFAAKKSDFVVVLTKSAEQYYKEHYPVCEDKIVQIYNPVASDAFASERYDESSCKIISVGRLSYPKNFERLIAIAAKILPTYPDWSWDIYGEGELRESLQSLIDKNGLREKLTLKGQVFDLYKKYKEYAFMVMTSRYEGFPMSLIEGAANRLPLLSFDIPTGPNEIISDGINGYLVDADSDEAMSERIRRLIEDSTMRKEMSEKSYLYTDRFSLERILGQWKKLWGN